MTTYLFVGERQSRLAATKGWHWTDGRVCAGTLARALQAAGIVPQEQRYVNLWEAPGCGPIAAAPSLDAVRAHEDVTVVALGRLVARALRRAGIPHRELTHPAARGAIRRTECYQAHVREVLS